MIRFFPFKYQELNKTMVLGPMDPQSLVEMTLLIETLIKPDWVEYGTAKGLILLRIDDNQRLLGFMRFVTLLTGAQVEYLKKGA